MDFDSIRPILSGVVGGGIATWLTTRWSRQLPSTYRTMSRDALLHRHRLAVWLGNALFLAGILIGIALYPLGHFADTDARPFLLGFGLASVLPLVAIGLVTLATRRDLREAYVAFAWGQGTPLWATYGILGAGVVAFFVALARLL